MAQTFTDLFGGGASLSGGILSVYVQNLGKLDNLSASASKVAAAILDFWSVSTATSAEDETAGVIASEPQREFIVKNDVPLIKYSFTVDVFVPDTSGAFDPDQVI
ncbi:hypothetical protein STA3757_03900 [Stanieria sp. NIES-3757]|nr:hypothetical protein STA3757_03900 [Stanieria sp. NIES-3757]